MQALIFAGEAYYPQRHLQDLVGTLDRMPRLDDFAAIARGLRERADRWERFTTGQIDWMTALIVTKGESPWRLAWNVHHADRQQDLVKMGCHQIWQDAEGICHGFIQETEADDFNTVDVSTLLAGKKAPPAANETAAEEPASPPLPIGYAIITEGTVKESDLLWRDATREWHQPSQNAIGTSVTTWFLVARLLP